MKPKQLVNLETEDLLLFPVWTHWIDDDVEFVAPVDLKSLTENIESGYIVLTEFVLANGSKWKGFCSPQDFSGIDYVQPVIFTKRGQVSFYSHSISHVEMEQEALNKIRVGRENVFPDSL